MDEDRDFMVVKNDEGQYSLWETDRPIPGGWDDTYKRGTRSECLAYIKNEWRRTNAYAKRILNLPDEDDEDDF